MVEVYISREVRCMISRLDVKLLEMYTVQICICIGRGARIVENSVVYFLPHTEPTSLLRFHNSSIPSWGIICHPCPCSSAPPGGPLTSYPPSTRRLLHPPVLPRPLLPLPAILLPNLRIQHNTIHTSLQKRKHRTRLPLQSPQRVKDFSRGISAEFLEERRHLDRADTN